MNRQAVVRALFLGHEHGGQRRLSLATGEKFGLDDTRPRSDELVAPRSFCSLDHAKTYLSGVSALWIRWQSKPNGERRRGINLKHINGSKCSRNVFQSDPCKICEWPMLRRMLLLLGETQSSLSALQYALCVAQKANAELAGLAGIDLTYIEAPMPGRIGATAYKVRLEQQLRNQAIASRQRLHELYQRESKSHGIACEWLSFEGDPIDALYMASETRDLLVTGHDTAFHGNIREQLPEMLAQLLLSTPRPIVVCGEKANASTEVLVAYDGSVPAMRAVQLFTLLGLLGGQRILVTSINASQELAARIAGGAAGYLGWHGYKVEASPVASRLHPADVLRSEVADRKIGTVVMGAYGHRGFQKILFGSATRNLVANPPCALFLYH